MQKLEIIGGKKISGTVKISGSKNAILPILAATILTNKKIVIKNIPIVKDVETMTKLLSSIGSQIKFDKNNSSITSKIGQYSSLAGMAGISLPGDTGNTSTEAMARIQSFNFFLDHFFVYSLNLNHY